MTEAYIIHTYPCIKIQLDYINKLTEGLNKSTRHLFCHILASNLIQWGEAAPISSVLIDKSLRGASWVALQDRDLIEVTMYSESEGRSRTYRVTDATLLSYLELSEMPLEQDLLEPGYNLITGRKSDKIIESELYDENKHKHPELIVNAINLIKNNVFNIKDISKHLTSLKETMIKAKEELQQYPTNPQLPSAYYSARGCYVNDFSCYKVIIRQKPIRLEEDIWMYNPAYRVQMAGRISEIKGGLQTASGAFKALVSNLNGYYNYDLKSSQVNGLIQQFEIAKLDTTWLVDYRDNPNSKYEYAVLVGVSVHTWKDMLCSTIMGSYLHNVNKATINKLEQGSDLKAILNSLNNEFKGDIDKVLTALEAFKKAIAPLKDQLTKWHNFLVKDYINTVGYRANKGILYINNPTGKRLNITELKAKHSLWKVKATLAAFILQGQEAAFIHNLTVLSLKHNYKVCRNEHDGLYTKGEIPQEAITEAGNLSGLKFAILVEKPFN